MVLYHTMCILVGTKTQAVIPILLITSADTLVDDSSLANTQVESISLLMISMYSLAPDRWATLAHAACKAR
jgi:hypothetical protein